MRVHRTVFRLGLAVLGLLVGLVFAELTVRGLLLDPLVVHPETLDPRGGSQDCLQPAPYYGFERAPGRCGTNSLGVLGPERAVAKPPGTYRVIVIGDSISEHRSWVELLEELLTEQRGQPVEVWNLGTSGYGTLGELEVLRHKALRWDPDLVLVQFCVNDYEVSPALFSFQGQLYRLGVDTHGMGPGSLWLFRSSALYRYLIFESLRPAAKFSEDSERLERIDAALGEMHALCQRRAVDFGLVVFPQLAAEGEGLSWYRTSHRRILAAAHDQDVPVLDLASAMGTGELSELVATRAAEVHADLEARLEAWGRDPAMADRLRALPKARLGLKARPVPGRPPDLVHPNFLGHYLAAQAVVDWLAQDP